jgi:hypothetical protein
MSLAKVKGLVVKFYEIGLLDRVVSDDPAKRKAQDLELLKWQREADADRKRKQTQRAAKAPRPSRRSKVSRHCTDAMLRARKTGETLDQFLRNCSNDDDVVSISPAGEKYKVQTADASEIVSHKTLENWWSASKSTARPQN